MIASPVIRAPDDITPRDVATMRAFWHGAAPEITGDPVALRDLRFAREGEVMSHSNTGEWHRLVAALLNNALDGSLAPCTRRGAGRGSNGLDVRSLHRSEVDWPAVEPRDWAALVRAGLRRAVALRLQAGEVDESPAEAPRPELDAARALLAHVPAGTATERAAAAAELVREVIFGDALAAANGHRGAAADLLGVPATRVSEALRAFPSLAAQWPAGPRGRAPADDET